MDSLGYGMMGVPFGRRGIFVWLALVALFDGFDFGSIGAACAGLEEDERKVLYICSCDGKEDRLLACESPGT